jgi:D-inositol-3-phosphate glycosyltransferase
VGGLPFTVVPELTGLLVPPKDEAAFATAIDRILSNPTWRDGLGEVARLRVEIAFTWDGVASRLGNLYSNLLAKIPALASTRKNQAAA